MDSIFDSTKHANEHSSIMDALHDSVICVSCGRFGSSTRNDRLRFDCRDLYLIAADMWLKRLRNHLGEDLEKLQTSCTLELNFESTLTIK